MPQPIGFRDREKINFDFSSGAVLRRPQLAAYIAAISNFWNEIEARISIFLAALLGGEASTVITIFLALKSDASKRQIIDSVVAMKLDDNLKPTFTDAMKVLGARSEERNRMIHGGWGVSNDYPDELLWSDVRETNIGVVEIMKLGAAGDTEGQLKFMREQLKGVRVYEENDFIDIYNRMVDAYNQLDAVVGPIISRAFGGNFAPYSKVHVPKKQPHP
jgi:hypothetical protein